MDDLRREVGEVCDARGHVVDVSDGEQPIEYLDGAIVGYCNSCRTRVTFPRISGGLVVAWVNALSAQLLGGEFDADLMADFANAVQQLREDQEAVEGALHTAEMVKEVVAHRVRRG